MNIQSDNFNQEIDRFAFTISYSVYKLEYGVYTH